MAFLRGTLTYQEILNGKIFQLLSGEVADDFSVTAPVGEAWERINTNTLGCPGDSINNPTNINNMNMRLLWGGQTSAQEAVSFNINCKKPSDGSYGTSSSLLRLQLFTNPALVNNTDLVAYWISITKDRIIMALQGDTSHSGNMNLSYIGTYTRLYTSTQDPYPVAAFTSHIHQSESSFNTWPKAQVCRIDNAGWLDDRDTAQVDVATSNNIIGVNPNSWDSKWYFYTLYLVGSKTVSSAAQLGYRGKLLDLYTLALSSWSNRDILTDGVDSWRLIYPFKSALDANSQAPQGLANTGLVYFAFKQS